MKDSDNVQYFDLHTTGIGYLNRVREINPENGSSFLTATVAALFMVPAVYTILDDFGWLGALKEEQDVAEKSASVEY